MIGKKSGGGAGESRIGMPEWVAGVRKRSTCPGAGAAWLKSFTNQFVEVEGKGVTEAGVATRYHHRLACRRHLRQGNCLVGSFTKNNT